MTRALTTRLPPLLALLVIGLGGGLAWAASGWDGLWLPPCPFHALTGLPCPGCGMTRACLHLIQGHLGPALLSNPFSLLLAAVALAAVPWLARDLIRGQRSFFAFWAKPWPLPLQGALYLALAANWAWNLAKY